MLRDESARKQERSDPTWREFARLPFDGKSYDVPDPHRHFSLAQVLGALVLPPAKMADRLDEMAPQFPRKLFCHLLPGDEVVICLMDYSRICGKRLKATVEGIDFSTSAGRITVAYLEETGSVNHLAFDVWGQPINGRSGFIERKYSNGARSQSLITKRGNTGESAN